MASSTIHVYTHSPLFVESLITNMICHKQVSKNTLFYLLFWDKCSAFLSQKNLHGCLLEFSLIIRYISL